MKISIFTDRHSWDYWILGLLIFFYPIGIWLIPSGGSSTINILGAGGFFALLMNRKWPCTREENIVILSILLFFLVTFASWAINGHEPENYKLLRRHTLFVLAILSLGWLSWRRPFLSFFWWGVVTSTLMIGIAGFLIFMGEFPFRHAIRQYTQVNPIVFGQLSMLLTTLSTIAIAYFYRLNPWAVLIPITAVILGFFSTIGSQTRGAWIAFIPALFFIVWHYRKSLLKHSGKIAASFIVLATGLFAFNGLETIVNRTEQAVTQFHLYQEDQTNRRNSIGVRLDLWKAAWESGTRKPLFGPGKEGFKEHLETGTKSEKYSNIAGKYHFPHSEYASAIGYHGLLGLMSLSLFLIIPGVIFLKRWIRSELPDVKEMALGGLVVVTSFAVFGLTDSPFEQRSTIMLYAFMVLVPLSLGTDSDNREQRRKTNEP